MNDKEAFKKWFSTWNRAEFPSLCMETWQAACDYKQKEIEQLKTENDILLGQVHTYVKMSDDAFKKLAVAVKALEKIIKSNYDMASYNSVIDSIALKALEEIRGRNEQAK